VTHKLNPFEILVGSALYTGYIKYASGTFGSLVAISIYLLPGFENPTILMLAISISIVVGIKLGHKFEATYGKDPSQFTLDEVTGTWISLILVPKTILFIGISFFIWRVLDILKPFPARTSEKLKGGWGIMMDDIISGFYTLILVHIIVYFLK